MTTTGPEFGACRVFRAGNFQFFRAISGTNRQYAHATGNCTAATLIAAVTRNRCIDIGPNRAMGSAMLDQNATLQSAIRVKEASHAVLMGFPQAGQGIRRAGPVPSFCQQVRLGFLQCGQRACLIALNAAPASRLRPTGSGANARHRAGTVPAASSLDEFPGVLLPAHRARLAPR